MKRARRAGGVLLGASLIASACVEGTEGGVEISVARAQLDVDPGQPEALAVLDVTVDLHARDVAVEVTLAEVSIEALPLSDGGGRQVLDAELVSTQGDAPVVRLDPGDAGVARIINGGTPNEALASLCRSPVRLSIAVQTADEADGEAEAVQDITVRCP